MELLYAQNHRRDQVTRRLEDQRRLTLLHQPSSPPIDRADTVDDICGRGQPLADERAADVQRLLARRGGDVDEHRRHRALLLSAEAGKVRVPSGLIYRQKEGAAKLSDPPEFSGSLRGQREARRRDERTGGGREDPWLPL